MLNFLLLVRFFLRLSLSKAAVSYRIILGEKHLFLMLNSFKGLFSNLKTPLLRIQMSSLSALVFFFFPLFDFHFQMFW